MGAYETYWVSYNNINLEDEILQCSSNCEMLFLHGKLDLQVEYAAINNYVSILGNNATYYVFDNLNHMFVDGTGETIQTAYSKDKKIPSSVIETIDNFINE